VRLKNVNSSFGLLHITGVEQQIGWLPEVCPIQTGVLSVTKMLKTYTIYYSIGSFLDKCGWLVAPLSSFWIGGSLPFPRVPDDRAFYDWWMRVNNLVSGEIKHGLNSLIILTAWKSWNHRNDCVFNGNSPSIQLVVR
jgi:hypothetical protein